MKSWSDVTPLTFRESTGNVDIDISYGRRNHGDAWPFDGKGHVLAHAFSPGGSSLSGDLHFDEDETWVTTGKGVHLMSVATHELGHALGLSHSLDHNALMYAYYRGARPKLHQDDINGIQALYGSLDNSLCNLTFDAIEKVHASHTFAFSGSDIYNMTANGAKMMGPISAFYSGAPSAPGAVLYDETKGKTYFFKGTKMWRFTKFQLDSGYPQSLPSDFYNIDAATRRFNKNYIFQGNKFAVWDEFRVSYTHGDPKLLGKHFLGAPASIDAAFNAPGGNLYFFYGQKYEQYYKHNEYELKSIGFPKSMRQRWLDCVDGQ